MNRGLRIVQTGTYASANKGDAAMQLSCAAALARRWPTVEITVSTPFPSLDVETYSSVASIVPCHRRRLVFSAIQVCRSALWRLIYKLTGCDAAWLIPDKELQAYRQADLVIDLSGDMLTDDYGPHVAISHYVPILNALLLKRRVFVCAQSIGPFCSTARIAKLLFQHIDAVTVRDRISLKHLSDIGIRTDDVPVTADMAFGLPAAAPARIRDILAAESILVEGRPILGVSVSPVLRKRYERANEGSFSELVAGVLDDFSRENNCGILFVPHVTGPKPQGDDRLVAEHVARRMREPSAVVRGDYRPEELKGIIGCTQLFLGARMHANIAALSSGVPVVALSYSHKTTGIMAMFGQESRVIDGRSLTREGLKRALDSAWTQRARIRAELKTSMEAILAATDSNINVVARLVHASHHAEIGLQFEK